MLDSVRFEAPDYKNMNIVLNNSNSKNFHSAYMTEDPGPKEHQARIINHG